MPSFEVRRIVTGHDDDGLAVIHTDRVLASAELDEATDMRLVWSTGVFPSDNSDPRDGGEHDAGLVSPGGSALRIMSMAPGSASSHHRTRSMDYGIVLEGEIELEVDRGQRVRLGAGDVVVQRGTVHTWRNVGETPCRVAFVLLDAAPVVVGGRELEDGVFAPR